MYYCLQAIAPTDKAPLHCTPNRDSHSLCDACSQAGCHCGTAMQCVLLASKLAAHITTIDQAL